MIYFQNKPYPQQNTLIIIKHHLFKLKIKILDKELYVQHKTCQNTPKFSRGAAPHHKARLRNTREPETVNAGVGN